MYLTRKRHRSWISISCDGAFDSCDCSRVCCSIVSICDRFAIDDAHHDVRRKGAPRQTRPASNDSLPRSQCAGWVPVEKENAGMFPND